MTLWTVVYMLAWCIGLSAIIVACVAVPMELMGHRVPFGTLVKLSTWGGCGLLGVMFVSRVVSTNL